MKHPPYHLRANKAVDRLMLVEVIRRVSRLHDLTAARFLSLSGPYLEDLRMMRRHFPKMSLKSVEMDADTWRRQEFHRFSNDLVLRKGTADDLLDECDDGNPAIVWLDFIGNDLRLFRTFEAALKKCAPWSVIKITLNADPDGWGKTPEDRLEYARETYAELLDAGRPSPSDVEPEDFAQFLQSIAQRASDAALRSSASSDKIFVPLCSVVYKDSAQMFTLTGILCPSSKQRRLRSRFRDWPSANLDWERPSRVNMPHLSVRERLHLERFLPTSNPRELLSHLGYQIGENENETLELLENYAMYHDCYPIYARLEV